MRARSFLVGFISGFDCVIVYEVFFKTRRLFGSNSLRAFCTLASNLNSRQRLYSVLVVYLAIDFVLFTVGVLGTGSTCNLR